ncbi:MAG: tRNA pseudouridine(38-40) synthase TruA [Alphaproteobacteria bacterium RIFCSPLOWO2_01_FULL_45_8]|nr:MAG: tRNA pseudouridine(38-40) synthase TruA [Alphaproteobacteria bacterium GWB1_45_5]OFW76065.1 MAG: tRNA pseudouridine(38-40) synthase TruA [Alphaproteobacteria bacterium GWA1_45_9]OFW90279.1 MAG: tRNA pseudouridine(38-40) synthase TruA [Alphaproteobacteria bacterium RIFCSPHIGHO2_01_FULL_41_14]OFW95664.1 MAG: tRNA pseudouridine(38-40) synthase TruA [Alphaproteobacteria bacterium RIFCSPLOWO2_01_FULL_45_8]HCI48259.1 tRNA pseudouridine(38-40) synthase TruA [Holosporales bacterium]
MTRRIKLTIEYEGTGYAGWQRQDNAPTIQEEIEKAILQFSQLPEVTLHGAGRTDAGVHALGQVAHVDLPERFERETVMRAINHYLQEKRITILAAELVSEDFHARFSAKKRKYVYRILNRRPKPALEENRVWHVPVKLDIKKMQQAADLLGGKHDFTSFRTIHCQSKNPVKTLESFQIIQKEDILECWVEAPSFLHHQVRNMVGTLVEIGKGRWEPVYIKAILKGKDRSAAGPTAPPEGLYFMAVTY